MRKLVLAVLLIAALAAPAMAERLTANMAADRSPNAVAGNSGKAQVPFDVNEVVRKASHQAQAGGEPAAPLSSGEFMVDTNLVLTGPRTPDATPAAAFDGTNYLVVWQDYRSGNYDIYGARVTQAGVLLDSANIAVSTAPYYQCSPAVAFDGTNYLVVWQDNRSGNYDIYGARVTPAGVVLDGGPSGGIAISTAANAQCSTAVAFDGTNYLVVWQDYRSGNYDIYGARVTPSGVVLDGGSGGGFAISSLLHDQCKPAVTFGGANYLVVWQDLRNGDNDIYGARVTPAGVVLDGGSGGGFAISSAAYAQVEPAVTFDNTNYLVVWQDYRNGSRYDIYGARVNQAGVVLDGSGGYDGILISSAVYSTHPAVTSDGTNSLVVWEDYRNGYFFDIYGARVTPAGVVLDGGPSVGIAISTAYQGQEQPKLAFGGANYLAVWTDDRYGDQSGDFPWRIFCARVGSSDGHIQDPNGIRISFWVNLQRNPAVAFDGTNYLVVWEDFRSGHNYEIYGSRVSRTGVMLDAASFPISTGYDDRTAPAVAFDGTNYLVVWQYSTVISGMRYYYVSGVRVTQAGVVLDGGGFGIIDGYTSSLGGPAVTFGGTKYLVVCHELYGSYAEVVGNTVTPAGVPGYGTLISRGTGNRVSPAVAFDNTNFLVVWQDERNSSHDIYGARVTQAGTVLDANGIAISTAANNQMSPAVAFDGTNCLAVWQDGRGGSSGDIYGARVTQAGTVLDGGPSGGIAISAAANAQMSPAVAFDGTDYLVAWQDLRGGGYNYDIYGAWVTTAGAVVDSGVVTHQPRPRINPALARGSGGQALAVFDGFLDQWGGRGILTNRVLGRFIVRGADVGCDAITMPGGTFVPGSPARPSCVIMNYGLTAQSNIPVGCWIDSAGTHVYNLTTTYAGPLVSGETATVTFGTNWTPGNAPSYDVRMFTYLSGDVDRTDDTALIRTRVIVSPDTIISNYTTMPPTIDGNIQSPEWGDANKYDISNVYGWSSGPYAPGSAYLYVKHDASGMYFALDMPASTHPYADWGLFLDENHNHVWEPDSSEGGYWAIHHIGDTTIYWPFLPSGGGTLLFAPPGALSRASLTSGHVQFETYYPFGSQKYEITANPNGDTLGAWIYAKDDSLTRWYGWWSSGMSSDSWSRPQAYRHLILKGPRTQQSGWTRLLDVPPGPKSKNVKDGGALAFGKEATDANDTGYVYAFKGNNRYEFYRYNTITGAWIGRDSIPAMGRSGKKKAVKKGSALIVGTDSKVYGAKGNNTVEFWCYDPTKPAGSDWTQLNDVPTGAKALKEGTGLAAVKYLGTDYIYFLKGSGTLEFYRYNTNVPGWETMAPAPTGNSGKPYKNGSCLTYDGVDTIFCLKGSYNEFAAYSISGRNWVTKDTMPKKAPPGTKKTKVKDGAGIAYYSKAVYALKGGNTNEFWMFSCADQQWHIQTQLTAGSKKVKGGGALTFAASNNSLYAFRGNNTLEFWSYGPLSADGYQLAANGQPKDVQGQTTAHSPQFALAISPNPFATSTTINYTLPKSGSFSLRLYDVTGKLVSTLASGYHPAGAYSYSLLTTHYSLAGGIYLLKLETEGNTTTSKLIIE
jgi:hypothetical protein